MNGMSCKKSVQILNKDITYCPWQQEESEMKTAASFRHRLGDREQKEQCSSKPEVGARCNGQPQGCITRWSTQTMAAVTSENALCPTVLPNSWLITFGGCRLAMSREQPRTT
jgi:hypothetical protein